jgi:hypothetical protein
VVIRRYSAGVPAALRAVGLDDVDAEGRVVVRRAADSAPVVAPVLGRLRAQIVEGGLATAAEVDEAIALLDGRAPDLSVFLPVTMSARGRRPTAPR